MFPDILKTWNRKYAEYGVQYLDSSASFLYSHTGIIVLLFAYPMFDHNDVSLAAEGRVSLRLTTKLYLSPNRGRSDMSLTLVRY